MSSITSNQGITVRIPRDWTWFIHKLDIKTQSVEAMREINNNDDQKGMDNYGKDKK